MAFKVENGSGIVSANSLVDLAFITTYLTDRGRVTENSWSTIGTTLQENAAVQSTDYFEGRFRNQLKGNKEFISLKLARATLTFVDNPADTETIVIGTRTYTFNTSLGGVDSILIGINATASLDNFINAINNGDGEGTTYGTGTVLNPDISANSFIDDSMVAIASTEGVASNSIVTTTTVTNATWTSVTLIDGSDTARRQPLSYPRLNLFDQDGSRILGVPDRIKQALSEYTIRAVAAILRPDPTVDDRGLTITRKKEKVGPIEEDTEYLQGARISTIKPYPAADVLIAEFLRAGNRLIR